MALFTEQDWRFLSALREQLHEEFLRRLNGELALLVRRTDISEGEKRQMIRKHVRECDADIADCFADWRRSTLPTTALFLRKHGLLTDDHVDQLSPGAAFTMYEAYPRKKA
jgi:hypothetical protein